MKKIIMALMCICMSLTMVAQPDNDKKDGQPHRKPRRENMMKKPAGKTNSFRKAGGDMVVNMQAIRAVGLDSTKIKAVKELRKKKAEELRALYQSMRPVRPEANNAPQANAPKPDGKKAKKDNKSADKKKEADASVDRKTRFEQAKARMKENREKMQAFVKGYRTELRQLLGDEKYIEYLEKLTQQRQQQQRPQQPYQRKNFGRR